DVGHMSSGIERERARAPHRLHRGHDGVLVRRVLVHDGHCAVAGRNVHQLLRLIPSERVDAAAVRNLRHDLARSRGETGQVSMTFHVLSSTTSTALPSSLLMKTRPLPLLTPPSGALPFNITV